MYKSLDGWSFATKAYKEVDFMKEIDSEEVRMMTEIIDPLVYKDIFA